MNIRARRSFNAKCAPTASCIVTSKRKASVPINELSTSGTLTEQCKMNLWRSEHTNEMNKDCHPPVQRLHHTICLYQRVSLVKLQRAATKSFTGKKSNDLRKPLQWELLSVSSNISITDSSLVGGIIGIFDKDALP
jgi:hypothetical protein